MKETQRVVELAGKLHWRVKNGNDADDIKSVIKQLRSEITKFERIIDDNTENPQ